MPKLRKYMQFSLLVKRSLTGDGVSLTEQLISIYAIAKSSIRSKDVSAYVYTANSNFCYSQGWE